MPRGRRAPDTSADHRKRIHRTLRWVDDHLGDELDLDALAAIAGFSKWHFHRVFKRVTGASPQQYVKRRRLELAFHFLSNDSTLGVNQVSELMGFSSPSNFARSFRATYAMSPRHLRRRPSDPFQPGPGSEGSASFTLVDPARVRLDTIEPFRILFERRSGQPTDPAVVEPILDGLGAEAARRGWGMPGARRVVVGRSIPGLVPPQDSVYDLGVEIPPSALVHDPDLVQPVPGGTYARYLYRGPPSRVVECWTELYTVWLKRSGLSVGRGFGFTVAEGDRLAPAFQLFLPVRPPGQR